MVVSFNDHTWSSDNVVLFFLQTFNCSCISKSSEFSRSSVCRRSYSSSCSLRTSFLSNSSVLYSFCILEHSLGFQCHTYSLFTDLRVCLSGWVQLVYVQLTFWAWRQLQRIQKQCCAFTLLRERKFLLRCRALAKWLPYWIRHMCMCTHLQLFHCSLRGSSPPETLLDFIYFFMWFYVIWSKWEFCLPIEGDFSFLFPFILPMEGSILKKFKSFQSTEFLLTPK